MAAWLNWKWSGEKIPKSFISPLPSRLQTSPSSHSAHKCYRFSTFFALHSQIGLMTWRMHCFWSSWPFLDWCVDSWSLQELHSALAGNCLSFARLLLKTSKLGFVLFAHVLTMGPVSSDASAIGCALWSFGGSSVGWLRSIHWSGVGPEFGELFHIPVGIPAWSGSSRVQLGRWSTLHRSDTSPICSVPTELGRSGACRRLATSHDGRLRGKGKLERQRDKRDFGRMEERNLKLESLARTSPWRIIVLSHVRAVELGRAKFPKGREEEDVWRRGERGEEHSLLVFLCRPDLGIEFLEMCECNTIGVSEGRRRGWKKQRDGVFYFRIQKSTWKPATLGTRDVMHKTTHPPLRRTTERNE